LNPSYAGDISHKLPSFLIVPNSFQIFNSDIFAFGTFSVLNSQTQELLYFAEIVFIVFSNMSKPLLSKFSLMFSGGRNLMTFL